MFGFSLAGLDLKDTGVDQIVEPEGGPTVARSKCYAIAASAFTGPESQLERFAGGEFARTLAEASEELPYELDLALEQPDPSWSEDDYQAEFLRLFDVGAGGPPCPLYGGLWGGDRMKVMEEVLRFYRYFGLKTSEERRIPPDHLATELEFLHYLTFREAAAPMPGVAAPYRQAQVDFLDRQPGRWVPRLAERLAQLDGPPFFAGLVGLTARLLAADREHLGAGAPAAA